MASYWYFILQKLSIFEIDLLTGILMEKMFKVFCLFAFLILAPVSFGQNDTSKAKEPEYEMTTYYMVFLYKGDKWTPERTAETEAIQKGHMDNITRLSNEGKLILAGPFMDGKDLRGIFVMKTETLEEAQELCNTDPAVKAGRLKVEIKPWYSAKGITVLKKGEKVVREQGTENREQGTGNSGQEIGNREQRTGNREWGIGNRDQGTGNRE